MYPVQRHLSPEVAACNAYTLYQLSSPTKADDAGYPLQQSTSQSSATKDDFLSANIPPSQTSTTERWNRRSHSPDKAPSGLDYKNVMQWLNQQACGGTAKRKRTINRKQRHAANQRERRRMVHLNEAFDQLRQHIPTFPHEKKLSRIQTLKFAIDYIALMMDILKENDSGEKTTGKNGHYWD